MKFRIKDEDGNQYIVEEDKREDIVEDEDVIEEEISEEDKIQDEDPIALTADEITALKQLASVAPKLMSMVSEITDEDIDEEEEDEDLVEDEDEEDIDEIKEEVVDTDEDIEEVEEKKITTDSKKSFGSIEKLKKQSIEDSLTDDVSAAWQKRLNGGLK